MNVLASQAHRSAAAMSSAWDTSSTASAEKRVRATSTSPWLSRCSAVMETTSAGRDCQRDEHTIWELDWLDRAHLYRTPLADGIGQDRGAKSFHQHVGDAGRKGPLRRRQRPDDRLPRLVGCQLTDPDVRTMAWRQRFLVREEVAHHVLADGQDEVQPAGRRETRWPARPGSDRGRRPSAGCRRTRHRTGRRPRPGATRRRSGRRRWGVPAGTGHRQPGQLARRALGRPRAEQDEGERVVDRWLTGGEGRRERRSPDGEDVGVLRAQARQHAGPQERVLPTPGAP